ncbi:MAG: hypothetical protein GY869_28755, partial [Planctomycetes bacterium]|nr:hypothetical protein [Planctomycetota bacterium]
DDAHSDVCAAHSFAAFADQHTAASDGDLFASCYHNTGSADPYSRFANCNKLQFYGFNRRIPWADSARFNAKNICARHHISG